MPDPVWGTEGSDEPDDSVGPTGKQDGPAPLNGAGPVPSGHVDGAPDRPTRPARSPREPRQPRPPEPVPDWLKSDHYPEATPPPGRDPVAVAAVACGFAGIVFAGILLAIVTAVLGATAGQRARESGRTYELPYLALGLAFVDAVVWIVLHYALKIPAWIG